MRIRGQFGVMLGRVVPAGGLELEGVYLAGVGAFENFGGLAGLGPADALEVSRIGAGRPMLAVSAVVLALVGEYKALQLGHRSGLAP